MTPRKPKNAKELGVTDAEYLLMLIAQDGHCALCPSKPKTRRLHVDHDHATGRIRGLLCHRCNRFLASWMRPTWLRAAADYLEGRMPDHFKPTCPSCSNLCPAGSTHCPDCGSRLYCNDSDFAHA